MAKTSSISLFAPLPPKTVASPNAAVSLATDGSSTLSKTGSFEQTLKSAQKPKASKTDDAQTPSKAEKPVNKKPAKASKQKASRSTGAKRQSDSSADEVDQSDAEATQAPDTEPSATADESPVEAKGDASKKDESAPTEATTPDPTMAAAAAAQSPVAPKQPDADQKGDADSATDPVTKVQQGQATGQAAKVDEDGNGNADTAAGDADPTAQAAAEAQKGAAGVSHAAPTHATGVALGTAKVKSGGLVEDGQDGSAAGANAAATAATTSQVASSDTATTGIADAIQSLTDVIGVGEESSSPTSRHATGETDVSTNLSPFEQALQRTVGTTGAAKATPAASVPAEAQFTEANHPAILNGIHTQLLPNGGTMQIRLDPPELGALQVTVHMRDGVMTASFETSNDDATQMLSHSLNDLKTMLEAGGVNVERMHVQQAPRPESHSNGSDQQQQRGSEQQHEARQEQQRRELLQRMWRKLAGGADPLDLVA